MYRTLERLSPISSVGLFAVSALVLLVPKINLISAGPYEGAGLRLEDFLILVFLAALLPAWVRFARKITLVEVAFFLFIFFSFVSLISNMIFDRGSILYVLRIVEYWALFYAGILAARIGIGVKVLSWILVLNCTAIVLQYFHLIGGWSNGVFVRELALPTGLTNGSYEAPFVVGVISIFLARSFVGWRLYGSIIVALISILMTGARIVLVAYLISIFLSVVMSASRRGIRIRLRATASLSVLVMVLAASFYVTPQVFERFGGLANVGQVAEEVQLIYAKAHGERNGANRADFEYSQRSLRTQDAKAYIQDDLDLSTDLSLLVRTNKWFWGLKSYLNQGPVFYLLGVGPGSMGNAVDSGVLRILYELGILGLLGFCWFLFQIVRIDRGLLLPIVAFFLISNSFIDYYLASKPMMTFLFITGLALGICRKPDDLSTSR